MGTASAGFGIPVEPRRPVTPGPLLFSVRCGAFVAGVDLACDPEEQLRALEPASPDVGDRGVRGLVLVPEEEEPVLVLEDRVATMRLRAWHRRQSSGVGLPTSIVRTAGWRRETVKRSR